MGNLFPHVPPPSQRPWWCRTKLNPDARADLVWFGGIQSDIFSLDSASYRVFTLAIFAEQFCLAIFFFCKLLAICWQNCLAIFFKKNFKVKISTRSRNFYSNSKFYSKSKFLLEVKILLEVEISTRSQNSTRTQNFYSNSKFYSKSKSLLEDKISTRSRNFY